MKSTGLGARRCETLFATHGQRRLKRKSLTEIRSSSSTCETTESESLLKLPIRAPGAGHWALPGMRERAKRFGGRLEVWSEQGAGTEIQLSVPAAIAYGGWQARGRFWFLRKKIEGT